MCICHTSVNLKTTGLHSWITTNLSSKQSEIDNLREANTNLTSRLEDVTTLAQTIDSCTVTESEPPLKKAHLAAELSC